MSLGVYLVSLMLVDMLKVFSKAMNLLYLSFRYLFWLYSCIGVLALVLNDQCIAGDVVGRLDMNWRFL